MNKNRFVKIEKCIFKNINSGAVYWIGINNILYYNYNPTIKFKSFKEAGIYLKNILNT